VIVSKSDGPRTIVVVVVGGVVVEIDTENPGVSVVVPVASHKRQHFRNPP
jgi:hypothetical protein